MSQPVINRRDMVKPVGIIALLCALLFLVAIISMNVGKMNLSTFEVLQVLADKGTDQQRLIVFELRLPRIVLSILVGVGMSISGCVMQSLLKNDLANPGTLGISSGSGLFVLLYITIFAANGLISPFLLPLLAFVGGITAALLIFLFAYRKGKELSPSGLILTGVAMSGGYGALSLMITLGLDKNSMILPCAGKSEICGETIGSIL